MPLKVAISESVGQPDSTRAHRKAADRFLGRRRIPPAADRIKQSPGQLERRGRVPLERAQSNCMSMGAVVGAAARRRLGKWPRQESRAKKAKSGSGDNVWSCLVASSDRDSR